LTIALGKGQNRERVQGRMALGATADGKRRSAG
jgi:hypothetical protein